MADQSGQLSRGGTHVEQTGDIALLHVISESAVAGGVRRIERQHMQLGLLGWWLIKRFFLNYQSS